MFDKMTKSFVSLLLLSLLVGCSKTFEVVSDIPSPLVPQGPAVAKLNYSDEFKNFEFVEKGKERPLEKVQFGTAQVGLFDRIFSALFKLSDADSGTHDLSIEPQVLDFQYSAPSETKLNLYEVWLKYRLRVLDRKGEEIADWVVKGYGKTPTRMLGSQLSAFNTASNIALRDVGAQLAIGFNKQPSIKDFLANKAQYQGDPQKQLTQPVDDVAQGDSEAAKSVTETAKSVTETAKSVTETAESVTEIAESVVPIAEAVTDDIADNNGDISDKVEEEIEEVSP